MWRMISRLVPATLAATLACAGLTASTTDAATILSSGTVNQPYSYMTSGSIANQTGVAPILFIGTASQTLTTPGTFSVGQFETVNMLPATAMLTYNNTPFTIAMSVPSGNGTGTYTYDIAGNLNGTITGSGLSSMVATVSSITGVASTQNGVMSTPPFPVSDIKIDVPQGIVAPNANLGTNGFTTLYAQVSLGLGLPAAAPEPASIAIVAAGLMGWGIRRRLGRSKSRSAA